MLQNIQYWRCIIRVPTLVGCLAFTIIHICIFKPETFLPEIESALLYVFQVFKHIKKITQNDVMINPKFVVNCHVFISADILELLLRSKSDPRPVTFELGWRELDGLISQNGS